MSGKKRNRNQDKAIQTIILITALINLVRAVMDFIQQLLE